MNKQTKKETNSNSIGGLSRRKSCSSEPAECVRHSLGMDRWPWGSFAPINCKLLQILAVASIGSVFQPCVCLWAVTSWWGGKSRVCSFGPSFPKCPFAELFWLRNKPQSSCWHVSEAPCSCSFQAGLFSAGEEDTAPEWRIFFGKVQSWPASHPVSLQISANELHAVAQVSAQSFLILSTVLHRPLQTQALAGWQCPPQCGAVATDHLAMITQCSLSRLCFMQKGASLQQRHSNISGVWVVLSIREDIREVCESFPNISLLAFSLSFICWLTLLRSTAYSLQLHHDMCGSFWHPLHLWATMMLRA